MKKGIKNVFEPWKVETEEQQIRTLELDKEQTGGLALDVLAHDDDDHALVLQQLRDRYDDIKLYQRHLQCHSTKYP